MDSTFNGHNFRAITQFKRHQKAGRAEAALTALQESHAPEAVSTLPTRHIF